MHHCEGILSMTRTRTPGPCITHQQMVTGPLVQAGTCGRASRLLLWLCSEQQEGFSLPPCFCPSCQLRSAGPRVGCHCWWACLPDPAGSHVFQVTAVAQFAHPAPLTCYVENVLHPKHPKDNGNFAPVCEQPGFGRVKTVLSHQKTLVGLARSLSQSLCMSHCFCTFSHTRATAASCFQWPHLELSGMGELMPKMAASRVDSMLHLPSAHEILTQRPGVQCTPSWPSARLAGSCSCAAGQLQGPLQEGPFRQSGLALARPALWAAAGTGYGT